MLRVSSQLVLRTVTAVALTVPAVTFAQGGQPARATGDSAAASRAVRAASGDAAAVPRDVRHLGGSTRFYRTPLTNVAALRRMSADPRTATSLRAVLAEGGVAHMADAVVSTMANAGDAYPGVACLEATPEIGTVVMCDVRPGESLEWMAFRPGGGTPTVVRNVRWAGRQPFRAYLFRLSEADKTYTFVVPQECGNVSLLAVNDTPAEVAAPAEVAPPAPPAPAAASSSSGPRPRPGSGRGRPSAAPTTGLVGGRLTARRCRAAGLVLR